MSWTNCPRAASRRPEWTDEEWLIVLGGTPMLRTLDGERALGLYWDGER